MDPIEQSIAAHQSEVAVVEWNSKTVRLRKLCAGDGIEVLAAISKLEFRADGEPASREAGAKFYVLLISKCYVDEDGKKKYDSDNGRTQLMALPLDALMSLGELANLHCGFGNTPKKN